MPANAVGQFADSDKINVVFALVGRETYAGG